MLYFDSGFDPVVIKARFPISVLYISRSNDYEPGVNFIMCIY